MRLSFAGESVGFNLGPPLLSEDSPARCDFSLHPQWVDLTPDYDPSGHASELDLLQMAELNLAEFTVGLEWHRGGRGAANQAYRDGLQFAGLPRKDAEDCRTVLEVYGAHLSVVSFLEDAEYQLMMASCESFALWPNPKSFVGRSELPLLEDGLKAALDEQKFLEFWRGNRPLYSTKLILPSFVQNLPIPSKPRDDEKTAYHLSQV